MLNVVGAAIIARGEILLVREEDQPGTWVFPGGSREEGETDEECLIREIHEEVPGLIVKSFRHFVTVTGVVPNSIDGICLKVFLVDAEGLFKRGDEIVEAEFMSDPEDLNLADATRKVIVALRMGRLL